MPQSIETKSINRIRGNGRGWVFSPRDFASLGSRAAVDSALHRLERKRQIRRVLRGIYDYPRFSELLGQELGPDMDQVAQAIARKFGWRIQASGPAAQNILGPSTQVPAKIVYLSDGPDRAYRINNTTLAFEHTALKEAGFKFPESGLIVQALKAFGPRGVTLEVLEKIRSWLDPKMRTKVLADTATATGWVYAAIQQITQGEENGQGQ